MVNYGYDAGQTTLDHGPAQDDGEDAASESIPRGRYRHQHVHGQQRDSADTTVGAATDTTDTVAENGADLSGAITLVEGADQDATLVVSLTGATGGPLTFTLDGTAQSQFATVTQGADELGVLTIAIAANGTATWTFNPTPDSTGNPSFSFTATVTDADGDVDADTHTISITEGAPPTSSGTLALVVDEKDLADGTTAGGDAGGEPRYG